MADQVPDRSPDEQPGEYTRYKAKIQLGDGPDQRGEITVETVRHREDGPETPTDAFNIELPGGRTTMATLDDGPFAEWYLEVDRATRVLRKQLGLDRELYTDDEPETAME